jgi:inner membrane protein
MDSLTHVVLGACTGQLLAGRQLGKKALLVGAIANSFPDIDIVASFFLPLTSDLLAHRGFTHSILFVLLASPLLAWGSRRLPGRTNMSQQRWTVFWLVQMFLHILLDAFNAYGTGWFEPFSHYRVSFNSMYVADPLFSVWLAVAAAVLSVVGSHKAGRNRWAATAIGISVTYLLWGLVAKHQADSVAKTALQQKGITAKQYFSTPTPLNNLLWYVVARTDSGFYIGYRSVLDHGTDMHFRYRPQNSHLLQQATHQTDVANLVRFSQGFYTVNLRNDTLLFNDLRFGEQLGWADSTPDCVFYYYLQQPTANDLIVQRGRFARWNAEAMRTFVHRIGGI